MSSLKLCLLGAPCLERDGVPLAFDTRKNMALIAYLAVTGRSHSRETLVTLLWPELEPSRARAVLRRNLSLLKKALGGAWLRVEGETIGLDPGDDPSTGSGQVLWLDVAHFRCLLQAGQRHGHPPAEVCAACLASLAEAVELYQGDFLAGFSLRDSPQFDEWQFFETEGLRRELAVALQRLVCGYSAQGRYETAIPYARRWLSLDPLHEPAQRQLMRLYAWAGQQAAALRQYDQCGQLLAEEVGLSPAAETTALYERIRSGELGPAVSPGLPERKADSALAAPPPYSSIPEAAPPARLVHNLPAQTTAFIGREAELAELARLLVDPEVRLLSILGPGGCGKTRLALEAGAAQLDHFAHGVFFVSLAPLGSPETILSTIAEALNFSFYSGAESQQQLLDYLRSKSLLLIMDNYEHLLAPGGTEIVTEILKTAPKVKILATSRVRLNVGGEHRFPIGGMAYPAVAEWADASRYGAVQLFLQGARRAQPDFALTDQNLGGIVQVCHLVEGMPLGIRLAAPWVVMLSPQEIAAEIGQSLDFLATEVRDLPERQWSIRAAFDHSWKLLTGPERDVFQQLSVFRGGFSRQAAQEVVGTSLPTLMTLVNKSLLHRTATGRYEVHELLRQFAVEKLAQSPDAEEAVRNRHSAAYCAFIQEQGARLKGAGQQAALAEIETERDNVRVAWEWAVAQGQVERLDQTLESLGLACEWQGRFQEGEAIFRRAAETLAGTTASEGRRALVKLLIWQSVFSQYLGHLQAADQLLQKSLTLLDEPDLAVQDTRAERAAILRERGKLVRLIDWPEAVAWYERSLALYRALGQPWETANMLVALAEAARYWGNFSDIKPLAEEALALYRRLGDQRGIANSLEWLSHMILWNEWGDGTEVQLARESLAIRREIGDRLGIATGLHTLGLTLYFGGHMSEACSAYEESLAIFNDLGHLSGMAASNGSLGYSRLGLGQYEPARVDFEMKLALEQELDHRLEIPMALVGLSRIALAEGAYPEAERLCWQSISNLQETEKQHPLDARAWLVLGSAYTVLAYIARELGQPDRMRQHLIETVRDVTKVKGFISFQEALPIIGLFLADRGQPERAVELYALATTRYTHLANSRWFQEFGGEQVAAIAATLPPDVVAAAQERGKARDFYATAEELRVELEGELRDTPSITPPTFLATDAISPASPTYSFTPEPAPPPPMVHNLPSQPTSFVGREEELAKIAHRLDDPACRLLTLTGPGGIGKTRLALQAVQNLIETPAGRAAFPRGVYWVNLTPISSTEALVATIAEALSFSFYRDVAPRQQLLDYLREKEMLLLLDDFEHLLSPPLSPPKGQMKGGTSAAEISDGGLQGEAEPSGATEFVADILTTAPGVKILVTSREALNLQGEWLFPVEGLPFPSGDATEKRDPTTTLEAYSAVQLFEQCARRVCPGFSLAAETENVVRICQMVEGMPLGIELAAAWLKMFSCDKITRELERGLDLLTTSLKDVPARHRSMRAVFEHSWGLLPETERAMFKRLSVFRGGFRQEAAEQVAGATFADLVALGEKSLLRLTSAGRYQLHELLRQFAAEKLQAVPGEKEAAQDRHSEYYLAFLQQREQALKGKQQQTALAEIGEEIENVQAAWNWAVAQDQVEAIDQALASLYEFYSMRSRFQEGQAAFSRATVRLQAQARPQSEMILVKTLARQGAFCVSLFLYEAAEELLQKSLSMARRLGMRSEMAFCLNRFGGLMIDQIDLTEAERLVQESLVINRELADPAEIALSLHNLGEIVEYRGEYGQAKQVYQDGLTIAREVGNQDRIAYLLDRLGWVTYVQGKYLESEQYCRESLAMFKEIGDRLGIAKSLTGVALAVWDQDLRDRTKVAETQAAFQESLAMSREVGRLSEIVSRLSILGWFAHSLGEYQAAQAYYQECLVISREGGYSWGLIHALTGLGQVACSLGDYQKARSYLQQGLETAMSVQQIPYILEALVVWATVLAKEGAWLAEGGSGSEEKKAQAVELLALVLHHPASWQIFKDNAAHLMAEVGTELPPDVVTAAQERGKARKLEDVVAEILAEG